MEPILEIKGLGKKYALINAAGSYPTFRDFIIRSVSKVFSFGKNGRPSGNTSEFWAVKDVSFVVQRGEALGIIGRNGSGKSTLLKMITGVTTPTTGKIVLRGKVTSLLEVGTGFHPELSGRENIFLNAALLGMSSKKVQESYEQIVEFSGVGKFIEMPVKHYSSGMFVRLAFAVAVHLEPEILILDEVLAVGDMEFRKKSADRILDMKKRGVTIIFVSHDMDNVAKITDRCICIDKASKVAEGKPDDVIEAYSKLQSAA